MSKQEDRSAEQQRVESSWEGSLSPSCGNRSTRSVYQTDGTDPPS